jgi:ABC-type multidrug transport system ATPase subunit
MMRAFRVNASSGSAFACVSQRCSLQLSSSGSILASMSWKSISLVADGRKILSQIDGIAMPGRMLAIMGPSGAGKTSLLQVARSFVTPRYVLCVCLSFISSLKVLAGVLPSARNQVLRGEIGGECCSNGDRDAAAFVGQDDRFYSHLSVRETLLVAAKLRLPRLGRAKRQDVVDELLRQLHLSHVRSDEYFIHSGGW